MKINFNFLTILIFMFFLSCFSSEEDYYNKIKSMDINSKVYDAFIDDQYKNRYVIIIKYESKIIKIINTFLINADDKIKKGDSIVKQKESMTYFVYRNGEQYIYKSEARFH